jgi:hypothetical protein
MELQCIKGDEEYLSSKQEGERKKGLDSDG